MAINAQFIQEAGRPYVHSNIYHFRSDISGHFNNINSTRRLEETIKILEDRSEKLKTEAQQFLQGKTCEQVSNELFQAKGTMHSIVMKIARDPEFNFYITNHAQLNKNSVQFQEIMRKNAFEDFEKPTTVNELIELIIKKTFSSGQKTIKIAEGKNEDYHLNTEGAALLPLVKDFLLDQRRKIIKNSNTFKSDITKYINSFGTADVDTIWNYFKIRFQNLCSQELTHIKENENPEQFLINFEPKFKAALSKAIVRDSANTAKWLGEDFKNALWSTTDNGIQINFDFINTGTMTEDELQKEVEKQWNITINSLSHQGYSQSDWILKNNQGYIVRAQDKNTSTYLAQLKSGINSVQPLKIQDTIKYKTLQNNLKNSPSTLMTEEDWRELDYLISNVVWFSRGGMKSAKANVRRVHKEDGNVVKESALQGIREIINKILSREISYFIGNNSGIDENLLGQGLNNTFFIIDNILLYPSYRMLDYIINQLKEGLDQFIRLQVTINTSSAIFNYKSVTDFDLAKNEAKARNSSWEPGQDYGQAVLEVGQSQGNSILESLQIGRINLKFDLKKILSSAYNFTPDLF